MKRRANGFGITEYAVFIVITAAIFLLCTCVGSVNISLGDTLDVASLSIRGGEIPPEIYGTYNILMRVRLPRVICVALVGAALSLAGGAMQGLL